MKPIDIIILAVIGLIIFMIVKRKYDNKKKGQACAGCHLRDNCDSRSLKNNSSCH